MAYLALDCTGETYSCGLLTERGRFTEIVGLNPRRALLDLPHHLGHLLHTTGLDYRQVKGVGVPLGPGSFTGVRLGITLAKTIAQAAGCGICAGDTLECLARQYGESFRTVSGTLAVALDARRGELYCGLFNVSGTPVLATGVRTPRQFQEEMAAHKDLLALVGAGFAAYPDLVPPKFRGPVATGRAQVALSMHSLCELTRRTADAGRLQSPESVIPAYHRKADIQVSG